MSDKLSPPEWLDKIGKAYWQTVAPQVQGRGLLTEDNRESLAMLCDAYATYRRVSETLRKEGETCENPSGVVKTHPLVSVRKEAMQQHIKLSAEFGLTPRAAGALKAEGETQDELDTFLGE